MNLPRQTVFAYGALAFPLAILTTPVYIFLPTYYAQTLGLGLTTTGIILLLARLWDVVTDFIIGAASDQTRHKAGRRHIWIYAGLPLTLLATWFLLVPGASVTPLYLLLWSALLYLGWTMMILPLNALGAELSTDVHERTRITGWREGLAVLGVLSALGLLAALGFAEPAQAQDALQTLALTIIVLLPLATFLFWRKTPVPIAAPQTRITFAGLRQTFTNKPFRLLLTSYFINGLANAFPATLFLLFTTHVLQRPDLAGPLLFVYFLVGILSIPVWMQLAKKLGKKTAWSLAMCAACVFFAIVPFVAANAVALFAVMCVLTGLCLGADLALPPSMQADVIDIDRADHQTDRAGMFFALWGMATKLALAGAAGLALPALDVLGFANGAAEWPLALLYAVVPIGLKMLAIWLLRPYHLEESDVHLIQTRVARV